MREETRRDKIRVGARAIETKVCGAVSAFLTAETDVQEIVGFNPLELLTTKESDTRPRPQAGAVCVCGRKPARTKFHFTQAVCGIREQYYRGFGGPVFDWLDYL